MDQSVSLSSTRAAQNFFDGLILRLARPHAILGGALWFFGSSRPLPLRFICPTAVQLQLSARVVAVGRRHLPHKEKLGPPLANLARQGHAPSDSARRSVVARSFLDIAVGHDSVPMLPWTKTRWLKLPVLKPDCLRNCATECGGIRTSGEGWQQSSGNDLTHRHWGAALPKSLNLQAERLRCLPL